MKFLTGGYWLLAFSTLWLAACTSSNPTVIGVTATPGGPGFVNEPNTARVILHGEAQDADSNHLIPNAAITITTPTEVLNFTGTYSITVSGNSVITFSVEAPGYQPLGFVLKPHYEKDTSITAPLKMKRESISLSLILPLLIKPIRDLWGDNIGRIFVITALVYFLSGVAYGGYLAKFSGGLGGISFSRISFSLVDMLALVPAATVTFTIIGMTAWPRIARETILGFIFCLFIPFILMLEIATAAQHATAPFVVPSWVAELVTMLGAIIWFSSILAYLSLHGKSKWIYLILLLVPSLGAFFIIAGIIIKPTEARFEGAALLIQQLILIIAIGLPSILAVVVLTYLPFYFGIRMAEIAIEGKFLSKVLQITLKQPLPSFGKLEQPEASPSKVISLRNKFWFLQQSVPVEVIPDVFTYKPEGPTYLIATFPSISAFYLPSEEVGFTGRTILLSNEVIYSMELAPYQPQKNNIKSDKKV